MKNTVKYQLILKLLKSRYFLDPSGRNIDNITNLVSEAVNSVVRSQGIGPIYPQTSQIPKISDIIESAEIPEKISQEPTIILHKLPTLMQGIVKAGHPYMVKNIIPTPSIPALASYFAVSMYMGNGVTGEDSGQVLLAELACVSAISKLAGIDPLKSAGVFTFD